MQSILRRLAGLGGGPVGLCCHSLDQFPAVHGFTGFGQDLDSGIEGGELFVWRRLGRVGRRLRRGIWARTSFRAARRGGRVGFGGRASQSLGGFPPDRNKADARNVSVKTA